MDLSKRAVEILMTILMLVVRVPPYITNPLWQDSLKPQDKASPTVVPGNHTPWVPIANGTSNIHQIQPYFCFAFTAFLATLLFGAALLFILIFFPDKIGPKERNYSQKIFIIIGLSQALATTLNNYSISGSRSPPYLVALLANFSIPVQFITRLLILRKWPTTRKIVCAVGVMAAELLCLIPSVFPSLESQSQHQQEGGAAGPLKILWAFVFTCSLVPMTISNAYLEKGVKDKEEVETNSKETGHIDTISSSSTEKASDSSELNLVFVLFWFSLWSLVFTLGTFWVDIVPGFGTSSSLQEFKSKLFFNFFCLFGQADKCGPNVYVYGWLTNFINITVWVINPLILRYTEGANYMMVTLTLRSPILLLFWTLFDEQPFMWHPHVQLSTYLSIGALAIMVPAIHIYNTGAPEKSLDKSNRNNPSNDQRDLLQEEVEPARDDDIQPVMNKTLMKVPTPLGRRGHTIQRGGSRISTSLYSAPSSDDDQDELYFRQNLNHHQSFIN